VSASKPGFVKSRFNLRKLYRLWEQLSPRGKVRAKCFPNERENASFAGRSRHLDCSKESLIRESTAFQHFFVERLGSHSAERIGRWHPAIPKQNLRIISARPSTQRGARDSATCAQSVLGEESRQMLHHLAIVTVSSGMDKSHKSIRPCGPRGSPLRRSPKELEAQTSRAILRKKRIPTRSLR